MYCFPLENKHASAFYDFVQMYVQNVQMCVQIPARKSFVRPPIKKAPQTGQKGT